MTIAYSQRDIEWAEDKLGSSKEYTMGTAGCLVTAVASMLSDLTGNPVTPGHLNQWLRENKGYVNDCLFNFNSVLSFGVSLAERINCLNTAAPIAHLSEAIEAGSVVIVQVDSRPGGELDQHWVRLLSVDSQDGQIMDPWQLPGGEFVKLSRYFASGWTSERAIFTVVVYQPAAPGRVVYGAEPGSGVTGSGVHLDPNFGGHQDAVCIRTEPISGRRTRTTRRAKLAKSGT